MSQVKTAASAQADGYFVQRLSEALRDRGFLREVAACYVAIFNARGPGEWSEDWTPESARRKLFEEAAVDADRSYLATWRVRGVLAGLCISYAAPVPRSLRLTDLPPACQQPGCLDAVLAKLSGELGGERVIAQYRELGIRREYRRGLEPVASLMRLPGNPLHDAGASHVIFWTSSRSRLYPIVLGVGFRPFYRFDDPPANVLMIGEAAAIRRRLELPTTLLKAAIAARIVWLKLRERFRIAGSRRRP